MTTQTPRYDGPYTTDLRSSTEPLPSAIVRVEDALDHLSAEDVSSMSEEDIEDAVQDWVDSGAAAQVLPDIRWDIVDSRFERATSVVDVEIDVVHLEDVSDGSIDLNVELHETEDGFRQRVAEEASSS